jgi:hypothetical protein
MRKLALLIIVVLLLLPKGIYAQDEPFDFERAYQDYVFTLDVYNGSHSEYLLARAQYKQAGTLVSQTKAQEATTKMLEARDDVVITYLTAIRMNLLEAEGVSETTKNSLFSRLDAEIAWFRDHKSRLASAGTLEDLKDDSTEAADRFNELTQTVAYETLATVPFGKLSLMRSRSSIILGDIENKISEIRVNNDKDTAIIERWAQEIENKITRSLDKEIEAQALIPGFTATSGGRTDYSKNFNAIIFKLDESRQFLRDATEFMREIVREVTTI